MSKSTNCSNSSLAKICSRLSYSRNGRIKSPPKSFYNFQCKKSRTFFGVLCLQLGGINDVPNGWSFSQIVEMRFPRSFANGWQFGGASSGAPTSCLSRDAFRGELDGDAAAGTGTVYEESFIAVLKCYQFFNLMPSIRNIL